MQVAKNYSYSAFNEELLMHPRISKEINQRYFIKIKKRQIKKTELKDMVKKIMKRYDYDTYG